MELEGKNIASEIKRQVENGFSKKGIIQNLLSMGYSQSDIDKALKDIDIPEPVYSRGSSEENYGGVTTKQMITGAIVAILIIFRIIRIISRI